MAADRPSAILIYSSLFPNGGQPSDEFSFALPAANVFVPAIEDEVWETFFLEAKPCDLPVVATRVGENAEVVSNNRLERLLTFGDATQLQDAIKESLGTQWDGDYIVDDARANSWDGRVEALVTNFCELTSAAHSVCGT